MKDRNPSIPPLHVSSSPVSNFSPLRYKKIVEKKKKNIDDSSFLTIMSKKRILDNDHSVQGSYNYIENRNILERITRSQFFCRLLTVVP
jgi:hypothetical protein